jgi:Domain of unknown function (DUF6285)
MQDRPTKEELLEMVEGFLGSDVLPRTEGRVRFHVLVAINLLAMVRKELDLQQAHLAAEASGLAKLLAEPAPAPESAGNKLPDFVRRGNERLCEAIRKGAFTAPQPRAALYRHLHATLDDKLAVANPRVLARMKAED